MTKRPPYEVGFGSVSFLTASVLGVPHAFPTREGGVSAPPYDSLNCGLADDDETVNVQENVARLCRWVGLEPGHLATAQQVHGLEVLRAVSKGPVVADANQLDGGRVVGPAWVIGDADAVVTQTPKVGVGVRTADCLPILIEDPVGRQVAAVHAGWRGVLGEIVVEAVRALGAAGGSARSLRVAVGPAIGACCFEVDGDLPARFESRFGAGVIRRVPGKSRVHLDLSWAVVQSLTRIGVAGGHIEVLPHCTRCDARFFSHRREAGRTGRHLSVIACDFGP